ncbi:hypothetical protein D3C72_1368620 [compost metagenome]
MDVISYLKSYEGEAFDIILADPPFTEKMAHSVLEAASTSKCFGEHTVLAIESVQKERMDETYGDVVRFDQKDYGDKFLNLFCHKNALKEDTEDDTAEGTADDE